MDRKQLHQQVYEWSVILIICALPFSRGLSSLAVVALIINWVLEGKGLQKINTLAKNMPALLIIILFLISAAGIFYTTDKTLCLFGVQKKLGLLVLPFVLGSTKIYDEKKSARLFSFFSGTILAASIYCCAAQIVHYSRTANSDLFFYHSLVAPLRLHAVYFSIWVFTAIIFLILPMSKTESAYLRTGKIIAVIWLTCFLFLLASKLTLGVFIIAITLIAGYNMKNIAAQILLFAFWGITLALAIVVFNTENPISQRFRDIYKPRTDLMENQVKLSPSDYLDGISLRLLFWKFGQHILEGKQSWLVGVSSGDSQRLLNEQITRAGLYRGEEGNSGYLNYNFHNQFVETTVQSGILGLACLSGIFIALIKHAIKYKNIFFLLLLLALFCFFLTESVLERQWGVISFALFSMVFVNLNMPWTSPLRK